MNERLPGTMCKRLRSPVKESSVQLLPQAIALLWVHVALVLQANHVGARTLPTITAGVCEWSRSTALLDPDLVHERF